MARKRRREATPVLEPHDKIANLLALLLVKEAKSGDAIVQLTRAGFTTEEVCSLLNTTPGSVRQTNYTSRKGKKKTKHKSE